jgi:dUTP pyrophosphatase
MTCCKSPVPFKVKKLSSDAQLPFRADPGSSGWDLHADVDMLVPAGSKRVVPTGLAMSVPVGYEVQIRPRSGLAVKYGITVLNSPGTVDSSFRGHVQVVLLNTSQSDFVIVRGDRIAQAVVAEVPMVELVEVTELDSTERGEGGFGSTGR